MLKNNIKYWNKGEYGPRFFFTKSFDVTEKKHEKIMTSLLSLLKEFNILILNTTPTRSPKISIFLWDLLNFRNIRNSLIGMKNKKTKYVKAGLLERFVRFLTWLFVKSNKVLNVKQDYYFWKNSRQLFMWWITESTLMLRYHRCSPSLHPLMISFKENSFFESQKKMTDLLFRV